MSGRKPFGGNLPSPADPAMAARAQAADAAAVALAAGETVKDAAGRAGIGERTLYTWMRKPGFKGRVNELRAAMVGSAVGKLSNGMGAAADVLAKLLKSKSEGTKLKAARAVLELATKLRESEELERRVSELESRARDGGTP